MNKYRVIWEIDIEAETPQEAAEMARVIQLDDTSLATRFSVKDQQGNTTEVDVDYMPEDDEPDVDVRKEQNDFAHDDDIETLDPDDLHPPPEGRYDEE